MFIKKTLFSIISYCALIKTALSAESGGMPQLDPEFWFSQIFWLVFTFGLLFLILSKFILPNISSNLENRKSQILENIEKAEEQSVTRAAPEGVRLHQGALWGEKLLHEDNLRKPTY